MRRINRLLAVFASIMTSCASVTLDDHFLLVAGTTTSQIYQVSTVRGSVTPIDNLWHRRPIAVDYDPINGYAYWTDILLFVIRRAKLDGGDEKIILHKQGSVLDGLAVDYIHRLVYYTDIQNQMVGVVSMNAPFWNKALVTTGVDKPRDIAVDPLEGFMYWTDWGQRPHIMKCQMDGKQAYPIVALTFPAWPNGIVIDHQRKRLYWCDAKQDTIMSSDLEGKNSKIFFGELLSHYFGIAMMGDNLYLTDWTRTNIKSINKDRPLIVNFLGPPIDGRLMGIHAYNSSEVLKGRNQCLSTNCSHLCLPGPSYSTTCACADDFNLGDDLLSCISATTTTTSSATKRTTTPTTTTSTTSSTATSTTTTTTTTPTTSTPTTTQTITPTTTPTSTTTTKPTTTTTTTAPTTTPTTTTTTTAAIASTLTSAHTTTPSTTTTTTITPKTTTGTTNTAAAQTAEISTVTVIAGLVVVVLVLIIIVVVVVVVLVKRKRRNAADKESPYLPPVTSPCSQPVSPYTRGVVPLHDESDYQELALYLDPLEMPDTRYVKSPVATSQDDASYYHGLTWRTKSGTPNEPDYMYPKAHDDDPDYCHLSGNTPQDEPAYHGMVMYDRKKDAQ